jgi:phage gp46-like protein
MADIETFIVSTRADPARCDYLLERNGMLASGHDIKTAVIISLFSDRRALDDDPLPDPGAPRRGWWGDALNARPIGSRLWLLDREKQHSEVVARAREYAVEALAWLKDEGIAARIEVEAFIVARGVLGLSISVFRADSAPARFRFEFAWAGAPAVRH